MFALQGVAGFLFVPMAMSVVFAMIASFILSRTLVPTMAMYLLKPHDAHGDAHAAAATSSGADATAASKRGFNAVREGYRNLLALAMVRRRLFVSGFLAADAGLLRAGALPGLEFLPRGGYRPDHAACPPARRHARRGHHPAFARIEARYPPHHSTRELDAIVDVLGLPASSINTIYNNSGIIGEQDGDIFISLNENHHPTADYVRKMREALPRDFPGTVFSFPPPTSSARS